jgi:hypothetical protein
MVNGRIAKNVGVSPVQPLDPGNNKLFFKPGRVAARQAKRPGNGNSAGTVA